MSDYNRIDQIHERIAKVRERPRSISIEVIYDKENNVWLGLRESISDRIERFKGPAAEGATPSEVLRKLADLME